MKIIVLLCLIVACVFASRTFVDPSNVRVIHFNASYINETNGARIPRALHVVCIWPFEDVPKTTYVNESRMFCLSNMHETHTIVHSVVDCTHVPVSDERLKVIKTIVQDSCVLNIHLGSFDEFLEYHEQHIDFTHQDQKQVLALMRIRVSPSRIADLYDSVFAGAHDFDHQIIEYSTLWSYIESIFDELEQECRVMDDNSYTRGERDLVYAKFATRLVIILLSCVTGFILFACLLFGATRTWWIFLCFFCVADAFLFFVFHLLQLKTTGIL